MSMRPSYRLRGVPGACGIRPTRQISTRDGMRHRIARSRTAGLLVALTLAACGGSEEDARRGLEMPTFESEDLTAGRGVWLGTCRACHLIGVAGAPAVTDFAQWKPRLSKGKEALYQSALNGIRGEDGKYRMPPKGGNQRLTEEQIKLAVDYKIAAIAALRAEAD